MSMVANWTWIWSCFLWIFVHWPYAVLLVWFHLVFWGNGWCNNFWTYCWLYWT